MVSNAQNILNTNSAIQLPQKKELAFENRYIRLKDFYNFIKSSGNNGENVPTPFWYFCPYFYPNNDSVDTAPSTNYSSLLQDSFFSKNVSMLEKLRYCIQQISFPDIGMKALSASGGMVGQSNLELSTIYGGFTGLQNSFLFPKTTSITISILNTNSPLVEKFIYPWMNEVVRTTKESGQALFPRINLGVKFWSPMRMQADMEKVVPDFIYYMTGLFPFEIKTIDASHGTRK